VSRAAPVEALHLWAEPAGASRHRAPGRERKPAWVCRRRVLQLRGPERSWNERAAIGGRPWRRGPRALRRAAGGVSGAAALSVGWTSCRTHAANVAALSAGGPEWAADAAVVVW